MHRDGEDEEPVATQLKGARALTAFVEMLVRDERVQQQEDRRAKNDATTDREYGGELRLSATSITNELETWQEKRKESGTQHHASGYGEHQPLRALAPGLPNEDRESAHAGAETGSETAQQTSDDGRNSVHGISSLRVVRRSQVV